MEELSNNELKQMLLITQSSNPTEYKNIFKYLMYKKEVDLAIEVLKTSLSIFHHNIELNDLLTKTKKEKSFVCKNRKKKVFVIGLSETGILSISLALKELGYATAQKINQENGEILNWDDIYNYNVLTDISISSIFKSLYSAFPNAYFIYVSSNNLSKVHDNYNKRVKSFFEHEKGSNFLEINLISENNSFNKWEKLANFLNIKSYPLKPFPRKNIQLQNFLDNKKFCKLGNIINSGEKIKINIFKAISANKIEVYKNYVVPYEKKLIVDLPLHNSNHYIFKRNEFKRPETTVCSFENAYLSLEIKGQITDYYLFDKNQKNISVFSKGDKPFLLDSFVNIDDSIGFIDDQFTSFNICHFLLDKLTRIEELKSSNSKSFFLFKQNDYTKYFANLLNINFFNLDKYKSNIINRKITFKIKKLNISSSSSQNISFKHPAQNINSNARKTINKIINSISITEKKYKVYIDRSNATKRRIINEVEIKEYLLSKNFICAKLEELTVDEQLILFRNATHVIAVHGAGLTNIAFCKPKTKIIEILPPLCATNAFWKLAKAMDLDYDTILATDPDYPTPDYSNWIHNPKKYNRQDVLVSLEELKKQI